MEGLFTAILIIPNPIPIQREGLTPHPLSLGIMAVLLTSADIFRGCDGGVQLSLYFFFFLLLAQIANNFHIHTSSQTLSSFSFFTDLLSEMPSISLLQKLLLWQLLFFSCPLTLLQRCNDDIILFFLMSLITHSYHNNH